MIKITQIKIPAAGAVKNSRTASDTGVPDLSDEICRILKINKDRLISWKISRRSIEARKKEKLSYVYTVFAELKNEAAVLKKNMSKNVSKADRIVYRFPEDKDGSKKELKHRPVIVGSGPAGMFCGYFLAKYGYRPLILERGEKIEERTASVRSFWEGGELNTESNVQFGEGGAGSFSDGKLNTGINDRYGRVTEVLRILASLGAPDEIMYDAMPHIGTDKLFHIVRNMRKYIENNGGEYRFNSCVTEISQKDGELTGVRLSGGEFMPTEVCILATGHSARDTMIMLYEKSINMRAKSFAVGVRISHPQEMINKVQWGGDYPKALGAAPYKLASSVKDGRSVYTFCMCPGGYVVNASSEKGALAVNGMSYSGRSSGTANSALIVSVDPKDYLRYSDQNTPQELSAISFQRALERNAYNAAGGAIPVQRFQDFCLGTAGTSGLYEPATKGRWEYADVSSVLPAFISEDIKEAAFMMGKKLKGFDMPEALIYGTESRTSSPVRIDRDASLQSNLKGLYPCGEGAGYAGGITSAAVDGIRAAEAVARFYRSVE